MQRRIKWVLWLILCFIVFINILQAVWVYRNYKEQSLLYERLLTNCLGNAVSYYQLHQIRKAENRAATFYIISSAQGVRYGYANHSANQLLFASERPLRLDSVTGSLGHSQLIQMQHRDSVDMKLFDSLFKIELHKNNITAPYMLYLQGVNRLSKQEGTLPRKDTLLPTKMSSSVNHKGYTVKTAGMLVNTYGSQFVYAAFKPFPQFVFRKLVWMLFFSTLLFVVANLFLIVVFRTIKKQKKVNEIKNDFINNMTHELRTPLTIASTAIDALLNHQGLDDKQRAKSYLQTSKEELAQLTQLVEKILNMAVADKEDLHLTYTPVNPKEVLTHLIKNHQLIQGKALQVDLDTNLLNNSVLLDRLHFSNALNNLLDNAIKYSDVPATITITGIIDETKMQLAITDNGIGIAKEHQAAIFEPFFRVPTGNLHEVKGFGLGLSYVKRVIEKHGGFIHLISERGKGSTFTITIPIITKNG